MKKRNRREYLKRKLRVESLESRRMLATWTVDPGGGGDFTTIQAAVTAVQSDGNADLILIEPATYVESV